MNARVSVRVQPNAKKTGLAAAGEGAFRLSVREPAAEGRANQACLRALAAYLDVPRPRVTLIAGATSRNKVFEIAGLEKDEVERRLLAAAQGGDAT
jgi:uncharacterized protein YggU (UPF0235/DUF167 family)